ncbi:MAG: hypothetical protein ACD_79C00610G0003 [uncultured bacterium]|nr:MAG: hypothetical protein ACD_79C00610G0003 [uncultured bacterium]
MHAILFTETPSGKVSSKSAKYCLTEGGFSSFFKLSLS